jgi:hypothetical protein
MFKYHFLFFLLLCAFFVPLSAQDVDDSVLETPAEQQEVSHEHAFSDSVSEIDTALQNNDYVQALYHLDTLATKLREQHAQGIRQFFPKEVGTLHVSSWRSSAGDVEFDSAQYVVFSSQLVDEDDNSIEFHVISEDPAILEYAAIVKKPRLVKALQDTTVVSIRSYKALEKSNEENRFLEHNIVINDALMLNVVISGSIEADTVTAFYEAVDFEGLLKYIK